MDIKTIEGWLLDAAKQLSKAGLQTARLDSLVLLEFVTKRDRAWLLAHPEHELPAEQHATLKDLLARRASHEPIAHLRGSSEFYGRQFIVSKDVLEPRPESEAMIELLLEVCVFNGMLALKTQKVDQPAGLKKLLKPTTMADQTLWIADVGAGSGALGITAAAELPNTKVDLLEIDPEAAAIAQSNVDFLTSSAHVLRSDLLKQAPHKYHILLCNLPYVPDDYTINQAATYEPKIALFAGPDGLDLYRRLFAELPSRALYILTESLPEQHAKLTKIAAQNGYELAKTSDFIQLFQAI